MIIYEMTATFGKLEHQKLTLKPGLNIIQAPNEWGKSTWCAFLVAMLYGMDTRAKTTKTALAEKEKYAPWSGAPMEGRMDLNWNGRDITVERRTKGRTPFGVFRAYETATGLEIPELTAANCGQVLLGVERSVFARAGFLRLTDLPVTQDEALRRRLNALVTTGDESGAADVLADKLKELKNRVRYNRSGELPKTEAELAELEGKCRELAQLRRVMDDCRIRQTEEDARLARLNHHQEVLRYEAALEDARRVQAAERARNDAGGHLQRLDTACSGLMPRDTAQEKLQAGQELQRQMMQLQMESQLLPEMPGQPEPPEALRGIPAEQMVAQAAADGAEYDRLQANSNRKTVLPWVLPALGVLAGAGLCFVRLWLGIGVAAAMAVAALVLLVNQNRRRRANAAAAQVLADRYRSRDSARWVAMAESYVNQREDYQKRLKHYHQTRGDLDRRSEGIRLQLQNLTGGQDLQTCMDYWQQVLRTLDDRDRAAREFRQADAHYQSIRAMAKTVPEPVGADELTYPAELTARLIEESQSRRLQLQTQAAQCQGRMVTIGDEAVLQARIARLRQRIGALEEMYAALEIAQNTLQTATAELQRRFAPRIAARAQELFGILTEGRYNRLNLNQELAVQAGAAGEDVLRSVQWRSEGTADQLYLALRLAVAEELTPDAPLILDDALVRFDDRRLEKAMEILRDAAGRRQVLIFTCQDRESRTAARDEQ